VTDVEANVEEADAEGVAGKGLEKTEGRDAGEKTGMLAAVEVAVEEEDVDS